ncbi:MAG: zinc ribbon domain-containing protein [Flavobacteriia bacterium]|jgi:hypothetical protein
MKFCIHCGIEIYKNSKYCSSCGKPQSEMVSGVIIESTDFNDLEKKGNFTFLTTLGILTLVGSIIGIFRGLLYQSFASINHYGNPDYIRGWLFVAVNIGTIAGAIVLLFKKKAGLYIYTFFQLVYLCLIIWTTSVYFDSKHSNMFAVTIAMFFFLPSLAFLIMYWTNPIRHNFK